MCGATVERLRNILTHTDNIPLEEIMMESIEQVEKIAAV